MDWEVGSAAAKGVLQHVADVLNAGEQDPMRQ
jgi:hypothetical protein